MNKAYKPGDCMKFMHIELHPALLEAWYSADIRRELTAVGAHLDVATDICDQALVLWYRSVPATLNARDGQLQLSPTKEFCQRGLYVLSADVMAEHVANRSLAQHVTGVRLLADCDITLVVFGAKDYLKGSNRRTQNSNKKQMNEIDLEMAITDLLVSAKCDTVVINTSNELALLIVQFTKAIAEAPHKKAKRECDEQAEFYMRGDNKKCVAVDKDGNGKSRLWQQMVAILPQSSLEVSRAVCAEYKTPLDLYEVLNLAESAMWPLPRFQAPNAVNEIADIGVARAAVPGAKSRRLGPEFTRKLQILFTSDDGDVIIE